MRDTNVIEIVILVVVLVLVGALIQAQAPALVKPPQVKVAVERVRL